MLQAQDSEVEHQETKLLDNNPNYTESKQKITKLFAALLLNACIVVNATGFSLISPQIQQLYSVTSDQVIRFNLIFPGMMIIGGVLWGSFLTCFSSLRYGVLVCTFLIMTGSVLRGFINQSVVYATVGQHLIALAYSFSRNLFTHVSSRYFFPKNRAFISSLGFSFNALFLVFGAFIPIITVPQSTIPSKDESSYRHRINLMYSALAPIMTISAFVCLYLFWNQNQTNSSPTSEMPRLRLRATCSQLFRRASFVLLAMYISLFSGFFWSFLLVAHSYEVNLSANRLTVPILCTSSIPLVFTLNSIISLHAGRQARFLVFLAPLSFITLGILLLFTLLKSETSLLLIGAGVLLLTVFYNTCEVLAYELAAEIGFPAAQTFTSGVLSSASSICILILINFQSHLFKKNLQQHFEWMLVLCVLLGCVLVLFVKGRGQLSVRESNEKTHRLAILALWERRA